jgi:hypothetical protein
MVDGEKGILPGAFDGLLSETIMEMMAPKAPTQTKGGFTSKEEAERFEANVKIYHDQLQKVESITRILIASGFLFTGHDPMLGDRIATNAIENNFMVHETFPFDEDPALKDMSEEERRQYLIHRQAIVNKDGLVEYLGDVAEGAYYVATHPGEMKDYLAQHAKKGLEFAKEHPSEALTNAGIEAAWWVIPGATLKGVAKLSQIAKGARAIAMVEKGVVVGKEVRGTVGLVEGGAKVVVEDSVSVVAKKPIAQMTDHEFAQSLANRAERIVEGKGPVVGTAKHGYVKKLAERYQRMTGERPDVVFEQRQFKGREWRKGDPLKGSVKPDVYNTRTGEVFDYKFGDAKLGQRQVTKLQEQLPLTSDKKVVTVTEIKPTGGIKP